MSTLWVIGDSTVSSFEDKYYYPRYGYGTMLDKYLNDNVKVVNIALSGRSSKSYLSEPEYNTLINGMKQGDYLLIGFNHDNTMEDLMYFQKKYPIASSNNNIEIGFRYPLPATEDKVIYCMASTNYIQLKEALINFFNTELYA